MSLSPASGPEHLVEPGECYALIGLSLTPEVQSIP